MYEEFYRFNEAPFRLTPDPNYLYLSSQHREAFGHLLFGIREGSGFVAVTGEIGTGKTTLLRALLRDLEPTTIVAYLFNPALSDLELLQTVNSELSLPSSSTSKKELVEHLNRFLVAQKLAGRRVVVIVDEAQALAPATLEQLRLLSNLETETQKLLQIILVGQPELRTLLRRPELVQLNQRITIRWHLKPLDPAETLAYIRHRLRVAGGAAAVGVFTPRACRRIHRYARGVPRLINIAAHHSLLIGYTADQQTIDTPTVRRALRELRQHDGGPSGRRQMLWPAAAIGMTAIAVALAFVVLDLWPKSRPSTRAAAPPIATPAVASAATTVPTVPLRASLAAAEVLPEADVDLPDTAEELTGVSAWEQLAELDHQGAAAVATDGLLEAWGAATLSQQELDRGRLDLARIAEDRGLHYLTTSGTLARFATLNLPAILELAVPPSGKRRSALLVEVAASGITLRVADSQATVSADELAAVWYGKAHLFWRDFEALPSMLAPGSSGTEVRRLQNLLHRVGELSGPPTLAYDRATEEAIARFQRSHRLEPDGIVGPLTKIVLYDALATYDHPRLSGDS